LMFNRLKHKLKEDKLIIRLRRGMALRAFMSSMYTKL
jgi:hypothetical protein